VIELGILGAAAVGWPAQPEPRPVRDLLKQVCPRAPRRVNRYIELALLGAWQCAAGRALQTDCALWLGSGRGYAGDTANLLESVLIRGEAPMPVEFINVSGNAAGFYVAQLLGLSGRNSTIAAGPASFEAALVLAAAGVAARGGQALVGGVDECAYPLAHHRVRLGLGEEAVVGEGSSWLLLAAGQEECEARLRLHRPVDNPKAVFAGDGETWLSVGSGIDAAARRELLADWRGGVFDTSAESGAYDSNAGFTLARFVASKPGRRLVHVSAESAGRYRLIEVEVG